ncbi:importin subunit alpha-2-like isoform X1 [Quercus lobata]|uniref:importin subunit alpha-2-like isoform X1 n=1 Tax=Quercus lobata TaxID=97700 RepID=UPI0012487CD2|nr:importin subunit alpha-2-like isoform X1 [Quercus lobata]
MSLRPNERTKVRRNRYKVAVDADEGRQRREDNMVEIRKSKREESLQKKRHKGLPATHQQSFSSSLYASATTTVEKKELANLPTLELIQSDGSPSARKLFILWNPVVSPKTILKETQSSLDTSGSTNVNSNLRLPLPFF